MTASHDRPLRTAEVIAVGSELLGSTRLDTNSLFIAERLSAIGIELRSKSVVGDNRDLIADLCRQALSRVDLVVMTGGLGPTDDDLTRDAVAAAVGLPLIEHQGIVEQIAARFARRTCRCPAINRRQAHVLEGAVVLANPNGTAPGQYPRTRREGHRAAAWSAARTAADAEPALRGIARRAGGARAHLPDQSVRHRPRGVARRRGRPAALFSMAVRSGADRNDDSRDAGPDRAAPLAAVAGCRRRGPAPSRRLVCAGGGTRRRRIQRRRSSDGGTGRRHVAGAST